MQCAGAHGVGTKKASPVWMNGFFRNTFSSSGERNLGWLSNSVDIKVNIASRWSLGSPVVWTSRSGVHRLPAWIERLNSSTLSTYSSRPPIASLPPSTEAGDSPRRSSIRCDA